MDRKAVMAGLPEGDPRGIWMQVCDGRVFYPLDPRPEDIHLDDIVRGVCYGCVRYNGFSDRQIFVGQHLVHTAYLAVYDMQPKRVVRALLLHDAAEAYLGDMIRPLKVQMPEFKTVEQKLERAIKERFDIALVSHETIKWYDNIAWAWEKRDLYKSALHWDNTPEVPRDLPEMVPWTSKRCEKELRRWFKEYEIT